MAADGVYVPLPKLPGRLTADLIARSGQGLNAVKEYELNLRGAGCLPLSMWLTGRTQRLRTRESIPPGTVVFRQPYFNGTAMPRPACRK